MSEMTVAEEAPKPGGIKGYFQSSSSLMNSLVLILPLFVIYQIGILTTGGVRNGVDFISDTLRFTILGGNTLYYLLFNVLVVTAGVVAIKLLRKNDEFNPRTYLWVIAESTVYGLLLGGLVGGVLTNLGLSPGLQIVSLNTTASMGPLDNFILSLGAGLYEEIVFRLFFFGGSVYALTKWFKVDKLVAVVGALIVSSLVFSGIHYVGNMADTFTIYSFMFRFIAGALFAGLYYARGLAVAVYTHAIYDIWVLVF